MAGELKQILNEDAVDWLAESFSTAWPAFPRSDFTAACLDGLDALELSPRARHMADCLARFLPQDFSAAVEILIAALGPEEQPTGENGFSVLRYMPHVFFIRDHGIAHFEPAMRAQYEVTKRFSAEFSIRAFIERYPERTYERLTLWARDGNAHIRRLVSEGTRPRLPWAPRLSAYQRDPAPVIALLEILKDDPSRYVQRSVANSINDIAKDHPDLAARLCTRWAVDAPEGRQWIIGHAMRSLVKQGHRAALALAGGGEKARIKLHGIRLSPRPVKIGGKLRFSLAVTSTARKPQSLLIDTVIHFVKANGARRPKVFKLARLQLEPGETRALQGSVSFADLTTRRHYPGRHEIAFKVNGEIFPGAAFTVS